MEPREILDQPQPEEHFVQLYGADDRAYPRAVLEGRLVFLDAEATLSRFMINGEPDGERFEQVVGEAIRGVRASAVQNGVRAYGEMVGVLWSAGQHSAAVRLEELWNQLL